MSDERDSNELLAERLKQRAAEGLAKYNKPLRPWDGRNTVVDAIEEALDMAVYLTKLQSERAEVAEFMAQLMCAPASVSTQGGKVEAFAWFADRAEEWHDRLAADIPRVEAEKVVPSYVIGEVIKAVSNNPSSPNYDPNFHPARIQYHHTQRPASERLDEMEVKPLPREEARKRFMPEPADIEPAPRPIKQGEGS